MRKVRPKYMTPWAIVYTQGTWNFWIRFIDFSTNSNTSINDFFSHVFARNR